MVGGNSEIDNYLKSKLSNYNRYNYEIVSPKNIELETLKLDDSREFKLESNYAYCPVSFVSENGTSRQGVVTLRVKLYKEVFVASRKIMKNEELNLLDFQLVEKEVSTMRVEPIYDFENNNRYRARMNITPESVLGTNMVEQIPDVQIGDNLNAIYNKGIVNISFRALARTEGIVGDIIKIKTDDKKIFRAQIISFNTVKIVE